MNRYELENAVNIVKGYYQPPSVSDHHKGTVEDRFESAKRIALFHMKQTVANVERLTLEQMFPKYKKAE